MTSGSVPRYDFLPALTLSVKGQFPIPGSPDDLLDGHFIVIFGYDTHNLPPMAWQVSGVIHLRHGVKDHVSSVFQPPVQR
jgi:hypothetical protein